jgi:choline dehydrogenase-like flavoprotein
MIIDLSDRDGDISRHCDIAIVGAGIAGLILATRLRKAGLRVCILEGGGREESEDSHPLKEVVQTGDGYRGVSQGRSHCLGGTSTRWGGALLPYLDEDLEARPHIDQPAFPVTMAELRKYIPEVEAIFGLSSGSYEEDFVSEIGAQSHIPVGDKDFRARFAKWPRFRDRNVATLLKDEIEAPGSLEVWLNATVTGFDVENYAGRLRSLEARSLNGKRLTVFADRFVICAGAIESKRLLLLLDRQNEQIFERCSCLGRFFYDHVSAPVAEIAAKDTRALNRLAGFRFCGSTMRSLRYELSPTAQRHQRTGSAFAHISFRTERDTAFNALRTMLRKTQRGGGLDYNAAISVMRDLPYLLEAAHWRYIHKQLLWPRPALYDLHLVVEQLPKATNRIYLTGKKNALGMPITAIDWTIGNEAHRTFEIFAALFDPFWDRSGLSHMGALKWDRDNDGGADADRGASDVYHPGGTTRMGTDGRSAVVDAELRTFAVRNLWVSSTSTFPTGGGANPTMTLMLFTLRLADHLINVPASSEPRAVNFSQA